MRKRRKAQIVRAYLERASWRMLQEWRPIVARMIKGHAGIYALYKGEKLYYVGLATNLMGRVNHHLKDRHKGKWERFSVYLTVEDDHIRSLEALVLRIVDVSGNKQKGKLFGAHDLSRTVKRDAMDSARDDAASMLGGRYISRRREQKIRSNKGAERLRGLLDRSIQLRARYKGKLYRATFRKDGQISHAGRLYPSPSKAAAAIIGRPANGWYFWRYKDNREWVRLKEMRG